MKRAVSCLLGFLIAGGAAAAITGCQRSPSSSSGGNTPAAGSPGAASATGTVGAAGEKYPAPRWPSYFKPAKSIDELMSAARLLARNQSGLQGKGLGILQAGDSVLLVPGNNADQMVLDAINRALQERKITAHIKRGYELLNQTPEEAQRQRAGRGGPASRDIEHAGIYQATAWVTGQFPDPSQPKIWLKQRQPDVYAKLFPDSPDPSAPEPGAAAGPRRPRAGGDDEGPGGAAPAPAAPAPGMNRMGEAIKAYLTAHAELKGVFWGGGGTTSLRRAVHPMEDKYLGTFTTDNVYDLQSQMSSYPGDVWQLAEEQLLEPLIYVDKVEVTDPEGTNLYADITEEMAQRWAAGVYQRGHLYMFPNQATGRFGYSFVNYPAFQAKWLPREPLARINGTLAGTQGHGGFFERWEVTFKDGFVADVKGGGAQGAALKEFLQYPTTKDLQYPYHNQPGYFYLYEIAFGTHPKGFRHPLTLHQSGATTPERVRSGVIHWGIGARMIHDPSGPTESKTWADFTTKHDAPVDHGWHTHTYFTTYKVRLRNANKWVSLLDKGHMTSLDNPEVRALASRYGDPNYLLTEDWIPEVPGINAPGDYLKDYAPDPGSYAIKLMDRATAGNYDHYFPGAGAQISYTGTQPASTAPAAPKGGSK
jgi:hypothetical protein